MSSAVPWTSRSGRSSLGASLIRLASLAARFETATVPDVDYAVGYQAPTFYRITITPRVIAQMDIAYLWMQGASKKPAFEKLQTAVEGKLQPGQYLKNAKEFKVYMDIEI